MKQKLLYIFLLAGFSWPVAGQNAVKQKVISESDRIEKKVIEWRRDFHQHPELGNQEVRTAGIVAAHLRGLGMEVTENIAFTGVLGILKGGKPGPVIALRADMDALPVTERVDVPFKSVVKAVYNDQETGVMHACGHDSHVAMLMGVAEILAGMKKELAGTVKFIFQPAEEGVQDKSIPFGADGMVRAGVLENPKVDVIFGLHINSPTPAGMISYKPGPTMAAVDELEITVNGKQTHGAYPWDGVDPVVTAAQIINGLQTVVSRNVKLIEAPAVVTVGAIHGGIRHNIIPESVKMIGTIRTLTREQRIFVHKRIEAIARNIAIANQCEAEVKIIPGYPVTANDEALTQLMIPTFIESVGKEMVQEVPVVMGAEDFSYYQEKVPGLFFFLGGRPPETPVEAAAPHHTPDFYLDESGFKNGVRTLCNLVINYAALHNTQTNGR